MDDELKKALDAAYQEAKARIKNPRPVPRVTVLSPEAYELWKEQK